MAKAEIPHCIEQDNDPPPDLFKTMKVQGNKGIITRDLNWVHACWLFIKANWKK